AAIPIYVVSADATVETRSRVQSLDVEGYFSKPVELQAIVNALNGLNSGVSARAHPPQGAEH
ncbi:MAG TPA: hypothetical protein DEB67_06285, partial [Oceanicaulis sp.]|nr:hypothetical protein [Oceanicaulis sp.]